MKTLWKNVEKGPSAWTACSACDGDYEDPDRTGWRDDLATGGEKVGDGTQAGEEDILGAQNPTNAIRDEQRK